MDRFSEIYRQYQQFKEQYQAGSLDKDAFQSAVEGLAFTDDQGQSWQIGVASGEWYQLQEGEWIKADPPAPAPQDETAPPPPPAASDPSPAPPSPAADITPPPPPTSSFDEAPQYDFGDSEEQPTKKKKGKKKRRGCLIIGLILAAVILCLGAIYVGNLLLNEGEDLLYEFESSSWVGDQETLIVIDNQTSFEICAVYISPTTSDDWGENWLSSNETIPPFSSYSFEVEIGETVDVTADDCEGDTMDTLFEIYVPEEGITITYSPN